MKRGYASSSAVENANHWSSELDPTECDGANRPTRKLMVRKYLWWPAILSVIAFSILQATVKKGATTLHLLHDFVNIWIEPKRVNVQDSRLNTKIVFAAKLINDCGGYEPQLFSFSPNPKTP